MIIQWKPEDKRLLVTSIQRFFLEEFDEVLGEIAAATVLEFIDEQAAPHYFNEGVRQAMGHEANAHARLEEDLFALLRPIK